MAKGIKTDFLNKASGSILNALNPNQDAMQEMWVNPDGNDGWEGSILRPYKTLTYAFTQVNATRNRVFAVNGPFEEASTLTFPTAYDCNLIGVGGDAWGHVTISEPTDSATTVKVNHIIDGSRVVAMSGLSIECNEEAASVYALHLVKTGTAKLYFNAHDVTIEQHTNYPGVYVDASGTSDKFNGDWNGGNIGGQTTNVFANASDRWRFNNIRNLDGTYVTGAVAGAIEISNSIVKPAYAVNCTDAAGTMLVHLANCVGYTGNEVYAAITESGSINGASGSSTCFCPAAV